MSLRALDPSQNGQQTTDGSTETSSSAPSPSPSPSSPSSPSPSPSPWPARFRALEARIYTSLKRPRVRLAAVGVLVLAAGLVVTSSVWTLPLVIVGGVMVLIAWIGS